MSQPNERSAAPPRRRSDRKGLTPTRHPDNTTMLALDTTERACTDAQRGV